MKTMKTILQNIFLLTAALFLTAACSGDEGIPDDPEGPGGGGEKPFTSTSEVVLHGIFQSGMVLQRDTEVLFHGEKGTAGQPIRIICSWENDKTHTTTVKPDGTWETAVETPPAGGPYTVLVQGRNTVSLTDVLSGDVWFCAGQSNMQMMMAEVNDAEAEIAASANGQIRLFNLDKRVESQTPQEGLDPSWTWAVCGPATVRRFSAAGYFFGRKIQSELGVPVGLINASWGNTPAEVWTERERVMADPDLKADAERLENNGSAQPHRAGNVYNAMVHPFRKFPIAGVIWYQGENNYSTAGNYGKLLTILIEGWRKDWQSEFPFYIAQVCPRYRQWDYLTHYACAVVREKQWQTGEKVSGCGSTCNDDIGDLNDTHPKNKQDVGLRLAYLALAKHYGKTGYSDKLCPVYDRHEVDGNTVKVWFKYADKGLKTSDGSSPTCFEIAGSDRIFKPATASINGNCVILTCDEVPSPLYARLAWSYYKIHNLRNMQDLPVSVFRTYDFADPEEEPGSQGPSK